MNETYVRVSLLLSAKLMLFSFLGFTGCVVVVAAACGANPIK